MMNWEEEFKAAELAEMGEPTSDLEDWVEEVQAAFLLSRALADTRAWLKDAKGPNSHELRAYVGKLQLKTLIHLRHLGQLAFLRWGMNVPDPKGLKE